MVELVELEAVAEAPLVRTGASLRGTAPHTWVELCSECSAAVAEVARGSLLPACVRVEGVRHPVSCRLDRLAGTRRYGCGYSSCGCCSSHRCCCSCCYESRRVLLVRTLVHGRVRHHGSCCCCCNGAPRRRGVPGSRGYLGRSVVLLPVAAFPLVPTRLIIIILARCALR